MVLVVRAQSGEPEWTELAGRTSRGEVVRLGFRGDTLKTIRTGASGWCRPHQRWVSWTWMKGHISPARLDQDGDRFEVRERSEEWHGRDHVTWVARLSGKVSGDSANGTVYTRWRAADTVCEGTVRFRARKSS